MADEKANYPIKSLSKAVKDTQKKKVPNNYDDSDFGDDGPNSKKKIIQKVDPKQFVVINPPIKAEKINESRSTTKIDYLIRNGLGNQDHLSYYRQAMSSPQKAINNPNLRKYVAEVLDELLNIVFNDTQTYNRVRTLLQNDRKIEDALIVKAYKSGIELEILKEVFARGLSQGNDEHAFNRVNSFIAGGKARKLDADLIDPLESPGGVGTDDVTKRYANMTPGQSFELIKKALKGKDND